MNIKDLINKVGQSFTSKEAAALLNESPLQIAKRLHKWIKAGWLQRQSRGVYTVTPLSQHHQSIDNPWAFIPKIIGNSDYYVCGWSSCEHFGLTEQIFQDISIAIYPSRAKRIVPFAYGNFVFFTAFPSGLFGIIVVWVGNEKILVSDIHKTIVDVIANPSWGGGIPHVFDCLKAYLKHPEADLKKVMQYGDQLGIGAFFKRFGFYLEAILKRDDDFTKQCQQKISRGYSYLDPRVKGTKHISAWQLIVPEGLNLGDSE